MKRTQPKKKESSVKSKPAASKEIDLLSRSRKTSQLAAIRSVIEEAAGPLSVQEIFTEAKMHVSGLGISTVYRAVSKLIEDKWLEEQHIPGDCVRYERVGLGHHHHFHCRECKKVFDIKGCIGNLRSMLPRGYRLEDHEILLRGVCSTCG